MTSTKSKNSGHRARLRERFIKSKIRTFPDYEILEMLLFQVTPRRDTKELAKTLLKKFGSLASVISAEPTELKTINNVGDTVISYFRLLQDTFSRLMVPVMGKVQIFNNWLSVLHYCQFSMGSKKKECLKLLFLNRKNILIAEELHDAGTIDKVAIYPREVAKQALFYGASALILIHNHPSGDVDPSEEDIDMTKKVFHALEAVNITLHDHLIVTKNEHFSFRASDLILQK